MTCRIYFVRHGETSWNALLKVQGHSDVFLSDRGREQAEMLAQRLANEKIHCFYSSDLARAYETARIVARPHELEVIATPALRELNFGVWEGMTAKEIEEVYPGQIESWWTNPLDTRILQGEKLSEMTERCVHEVKNIINKHDNETVLVVAHGGAIRSIICSVLGINLNEQWRLHLDNACLNLVDFPRWERGILKLFNDCTHLKK
ncbi:alpha-ribazole phosphatase [Pelotomaculum terephthalicicum JT]|uniref:alpha-ribazole phosphatase n=1 Tax=Pelotomaculum TaxID=191373 RepID=UPI0009CB266F|nr:MULTISPECIES: alpha-ribazole phosphatase [Pelotomaculum]MCG9968159.1 alpha-ribazole phosphatase [Pelotomaculum terephthalicicum JT]OPX83945.1 MAG: Phosphoserine phosphatase 1 [Pelotomaculum sp. PtaB.Bin117]OPY63178.1 MAG: Phosphoserine phosphatase 1 [Pelotomaculum sp. PtaU1.Bin065]